MAENKESVFYKFIKKAVTCFYPKIEVLGTENLPDEPCVIVGNHAQMHGPICAKLYCPGKHDTWCAGEMMHLKDVPEHAFRDFWSRKPKWTHPWFKLLSYLIASNLKQMHLATRSVLSPTGLWTKSGIGSVNI